MPPSSSCATASVRWSARRPGRAVNELAQLPETGTGRLRTRPRSPSRRRGPRAPASWSWPSSVRGSWPAASRRRHRSPAARERRRDRRRADRPDPDLRRGLGSALQPGRHARRPSLRHHDTADAGLYIAAQIVGALHRDDAREPDVRPAGRRAVDQGPIVAARCGSPRSIATVTSAARHPRLRSHRTRQRRRLRGRDLDRRRLLVHVLDELREPGGHDRTHALRTPSPASSRRRHRCSSSCSSSVPSSPTG